MITLNQHINTLLWHLIELWNCWLKNIFLFCRNFFILWLSIYTSVIFYLDLSFFTTSSSNNIQISFFERHFLNHSLPFLHSGVSFHFLAGHSWKKHQSALVSWYHVSIKYLAHIKHLFRNAPVHNHDKHVTVSFFDIEWIFFEVSFDLRFLFDQNVGTFDGARFNHWIPIFIFAVWCHQFNQSVYVQLWSFEKFEFFENKFISFLIPIK